MLLIWAVLENFYNLDWGILRLYARWACAPFAVALILIKSEAEGWSIAVNEFISLNAMMKFEGA